MATPAENARAALLMTGSMAFFTFNDTAMKSLAGEVPLLQALFVRGLIASALIVAAARWLGGLDLRLPRRDWMLLALRSVSEAGAAFFFLTAVFNMPIANATAIIQALPLTITLAAALFLGEPVGWRRMAAIVVGFAGVLLIVRPGIEGFSPYALSALASVLCITLRDIAARQFSARASLATVALGGALAVMVMGGAATAAQGWTTMTQAHWVAILAAAGFLVVAYLMSILVMQVGDIAFAAPFRYTGLVWAMLLGLVFFAEWPDLLTFCGAALIVGSGLFAFYRERRLSRRQAAAASRRAC